MILEFVEPNPFADSIFSVNYLVPGTKTKAITSTVVTFHTIFGIETDNTPEMKSLYHVKY